MKVLATLAAFAVCLGFVSAQGTNLTGRTGQLVIGPNTVGISCSSVTLCPGNQVNVPVTTNAVVRAAGRLGGLYAIEVQSPTPILCPPNMPTFGLDLLPIGNVIHVGVMNTANPGSGCPGQAVFPITIPGGFSFLLQVAAQTPSGLTGYATPVRVN